jgi:tRNA threonylcarbamoyladenosine biosynthesis protein TsaB
LPARPLLGIETSGRDTGVAVIDGSAVRFELTVQTESGHNENLPRLLKRALVAAGVAARDLAGIGVTAGPGMFTSLRVGLAAAKGLALPWAIPLKGVSTLLALAETAAGPDPKLVLVDARRGQVYVGLYDRGQAALGPTVMPVSAVAQLVLALSPGPLLLAGDGSALCADSLQEAGIPVRNSGIGSPSARVVATVAGTLLSRDGGDDPARLAPTYLRRTDAELRRAGTAV